MATLLAPLRGMALKELRCFNTKVADLSPLQGMPLEHLHVSGTPVTDLTPLRGMGLITLKLHGCTQLTDLSPLAEARGLTTLTVPPNTKDIEFLRAFPKLERIGFSADPKNPNLPAKTREEFWKEYDSQGWLRALRASGLAIKSASQLEDGTWALNFEELPIRDLTPLRGEKISILNLSKTAVTDLEPLRGLALKELNIAETRVSDLTPLRGMRLKKLSFGKTKVADLSPLKGMPIEVLLAADTQVTDLSPLRGMPLARMTFFKCLGLSDLSPLADCKELQNLTLPPNAQAIEFLRDSSKFPKLERLGFGFDPKTFLPDQTAAEFWKEYDARK